MSLELSRMVEDFSAATLTLAASSDLSSTERATIEGLQDDRITFKDREVVIREGDMLDRCLIVRSGWLARQRHSADGQVVTTNVYLPGDFVTIHLGFRRSALFDVIALEDSEIAVVDADRLKDAIASSDVLASAINWSGVRAFNIISEHVFGMSTRPSTERVLHMLLELWCRLVVIGEASDSGFHIPLSQKEIGEMVGLSLVSVNRSIQTLRRSGMITLESGRLQFSDLEQCMLFCDFDPTYLETFTPLGSADLEYYIKEA